eukprot:TRINITY_DN123_c0_g1_i1.p2 TRINITY_DN123_c0_g1~~TRINITY_DN123_c0_g1_i1.p2  ORF type:complete len:153 (+),score=33.35 TRINITY_DN123_c0_g1_i1:57-461(+)
MHPSLLRQELFRAHEELNQLKYKLRRNSIPRSHRERVLRDRSARRARGLEQQVRTMKMLLAVAWRHQEQEEAVSSQEEAVAPKEEAVVRKEPAARPCPASSARPSPCGGEPHSARSLPALLTTSHRSLPAIKAL